MLQFKLEVMSEIPFAVFLLLTVLLFDRYRSNLLWAIGIGILLGFTVSIRSIGWALLAAIPVFYLLNRKLESLKNLSVIFGIGILTALTINQIFIGNAAGSGYTMLFDNYNFLIHCSNDELNLARAFKTLLLPEVNIKIITPTTQSNNTPNCGQLCDSCDCHVFQECDCYLLYTNIVTALIRFQFFH